MGQSTGKPLTFRTMLNTTDSDQLDEMLKSKQVDLDKLRNLAGYKQVTFLWLAIQLKRSRLAVDLLKLGANPNIRCGSLNSTALHIAVIQKQLDVIPACLNAGANPGALDRWNYSPLHYAAVQTDSDYVLALFDMFLTTTEVDINCGATLEAPHPNTFNTDISGTTRNLDDWQFQSVPYGPTTGTALHLAAHNACLPNQCLQLLLDAGTNVNSRSLIGHTPLMRAVMDVYYDYHSYNQDHVRLLLQAGADVHAADSSGWTALHYAAMQGSVIAMNQLLCAGADPDARGNYGETPLWILLILGWKDACNFLLNWGCSTNLPLQKSVLLFLDKKLKDYRSVTRELFNGQSDSAVSIFPLDYALLNSHCDLAELLLQAGGRTKLNYETRYLFRHRPILVHSLQELCCAVIRCAIKKSIPIRVQKLVIPQCLKSLICQAPRICWHVFEY